MNNFSPAPGSDDRVIPLDLLAAARLGELTPEQATELSAVLRSNPAARREYTEHLLLSADLSWERTAQRLATPTPASSISHKPVLSHAKVRMRLRIAPAAYALAASLVLIAAAAAIYLFAFTNPESPTPNPSSAPIATLVETNTDIVINDDLGQTGAEYAAGTYSIESGSAELQVRSGANVRLRGATRVSLDTPMDASLARGTVRVNCPQSAHGYTVHLPNGARVIDLGTVFTVTVDDTGRAGVWVIEGSVAVESPAGDRRVVVADQLVSIDPVGVASEATPQQRIRLALSSTGSGVEPGAADPRWTVRQDDETDASPAYAMRFPDFSYLRADSGARWISVNHPNGFAASGASFVFETTIDLGNLEPATVVLDGRLAADNRVRAIRVNGQPVDVTGDPLDGFQVWRSLRIDDGFVAGANRIEIEVYNETDTLDNSPVGLMLDWSATGVPVTLDNE